MDPELYRALARYNSWMTGRLYETCAELSDAQRREDRGAFFKSIHSTLNHILFADSVWMNRFTGRSYAHRGMGVDIHDDFDALRQAHLAITDEISNWVETLDVEWLAGDLTWTSSDGKRTSTRPRWLLVSHLFNHQTHHRGQITTMLSQCGLDIGVTDLPFVPEQTGAHTTKFADTPNGQSAADI
ncbi:DinB family protein [Roseibium litorale]|uniref:Damage-inducible protein DinB n=1 Tax=Roseibium litorale TaxID=2803841 RepID=A0ABR9CHS7_9HYPH|nr:DinB family protein [Roseibium litorale]MBD8890392.1 damage-inducible protein DinB [Roseibium litorale]